MADPGVEANVFQIPDLVGAANKQQQQNLLRGQQRDYRSDQFLKGFKKQQGRYLPGHKSVVNGLFTDLMSKKDAYKMNPSAANQRAVEQANNLYLDGAASGQFAFDEVTKQRNFVLQNPSKIAESIPEYNKRVYDLSNEQGATIESIQNLIDNPGLYTPKVGQTKKILSPSAYGTKIGQGKIGQRVLAEARAGDGTIDKEKARSIFREQYNLDYGKESNPNGYANHVLYQAGVDGTLDVQIKEDGQVMFDPSIDILGTISSDAFPRERLAGNAYNTGETTFINTLADMVRVPDPTGSNKSKISVKTPREVFISGEKWEESYRNLPEQDPDDPNSPANKRDSVPLLVVNFRTASDNINKVNAFVLDTETDDVYLQRTVGGRGKKVTEEDLVARFGRDSGGRLLATDTQREAFQKERDDKAPKKTSYELITEEEFSPLLSVLKEDDIRKIAEMLGLSYEQLRAKALEQSQRGNIDTDITEEEAIATATEVINNEEA